MARSQHHKALAQQLAAAWNSRYPPLVSTSDLMVGFSAVENWIDAGLSYLGIHPRQSKARTIIINRLRQMELAVPGGGPVSGGIPASAPRPLLDQAGSWWLGAKSVLDAIKMTPGGNAATAPQLDQLLKRDFSGWVADLEFRFDVPQDEKDYNGRLS